jgi:DUF1365 family protein
VSVDAEICRGGVMHKRFRPRVHQFAYDVFFVRVPLRALASASNRWFGYNRWRLMSLFDKDFGPRDGSDLDTWARRLLREHGVDVCDGDIVLQAFPRLLGYVFNPITIWYCYDRQGQLRAAICEVNNTFGERHNYVVAHADARPIQPTDWLRARKCFHVSPFCEVRGHYRFRFEQTDARAFAQVDFYDGADDADKLIVTTMHGVPEPLNASNALRAFISHPLMTFGVVARIHWQALKLWRKRVPFFAKPEPPRQQTTSALSGIPISTLQPTLPPTLLSSHPLNSIES